jgi:hypothetical protein
MKHCKFCDIDKDPSCFPVNKDAKDGRHSKCRQCLHEYYKKWIQRPDVRAKKKSEWDKPYKDRVLVEPLKIKARDLLRHSVKSGAIIKPKECSVCGKSPKRLEGHHNDYSKPLDVIWCCTSCHGKIHREFKY